MKKKFDLFEFVVNVGGIQYYANTVKDAVLFQTWDVKPNFGMVSAMDAIGAAAHRYGFTRMQTFVEKFEESSNILLEYIWSKSGVVMWTDGRMTQYEWRI